MSRQLVKQFVIILCAVGIGMLNLHPGTAAADSKQSRTGFSVSPAQLNMTVSQAHPQQSATIQIANKYATPLTLTVELRGIDESSARLVPTGELDQVFSRTISLSATELTIAAHATAELDVVVSNTAALQPGGHYATIVLTEQADASAIPAFRPAIAVALFVIKSDGVRTNLQLTGIHASHTLFTLPSSVTLDFNNGGNTHVIPRASAGIYDTGLETLYSKAVFNTNSLPLFPGNHASYTEQLTSYQRIGLPKRLQLRVTYRIDGSDVQLVQSIYFWYVPIVDIVSLVLLAVIAFWQRKRIRKLLRWLKGIGRRILRIAKKPLDMRTARKASETAATERREKKLGTAVVRTHQDASRKMIRKRASHTFGKTLVHKVEPSPTHIQVVNEPKPQKAAEKTTKVSKAIPTKTTKQKKVATKSSTKKTTQSKATKKSTSKTKSK